jgi:hypothetical protein
MDFRGITRGRRDIPENSSTLARTQTGTRAILSREYTIDEATSCSHFLSNSSVLGE